MIDTRERDLADKPPADLAALEDYAEGTSSTLLYLALEVLGAAEPKHRRRARGRHRLCPGRAVAGDAVPCPAGRCYIPQEIAGAVGLDPADYQACAIPLHCAPPAPKSPRRPQGTWRPGGYMRREIPRRARAAMLPAVIADRFLERLKRAGYNPFAAELAAPDTLQSWRLAAAALRNQF